jgi:hypothetical protein
MLRYNLGNGRRYVRADSSLPVACNRWQSSLRAGVRDHGIFSEMHDTLSPDAIAKLNAVKEQLAAMTPSKQRAFAAKTESLRRRMRAEAAADGDAEPEERVCPRCGMTRLVDDFKRRSLRQGYTPSWCKLCVNAADRDRRRRKRKESLTGLGKHIRRGTSPAKVETVVASLLRRLGGAEVVGQELADLCRRSLNSGSRRDGWRALCLVLHMCEAAEEISRRRRGQGR